MRRHKSSENVFIATSLSPSSSPSANVTPSSLIVTSSPEQSGITSSQSANVVISSPSSGLTSLAADGLISSSGLMTSSHVYTTSLDRVIDNMTSSSSSQPADILLTVETVDMSSSSSAMTSLPENTIVTSSGFGMTSSVRKSVPDYDK